MSAVKPQTEAHLLPIEKSSLYGKILRRWFPREFVKRGMQRRKLQYQASLKAANTADEKWSVSNAYLIDMQEWSQWLQSIKDIKLLRIASKMDIALEDFPSPEQLPDESPGHWIADEDGNRFLRAESRRAIHKAMRERAPAFRKERREAIDLYLKIFMAVCSAVTGIGGTLIGIIAISKK